MIAWHVTTLAKLSRYRATGSILPPVRAWRNIADAERFSIQTGRRVILRVKLPTRDVDVLGGHRGAAVVCSSAVKVEA